MVIDFSIGNIPYFNPSLMETAETLEKEVVEALEAEAESLSTDRRKQFLAGMRQHAGDILKFLDLMEKEGAFPFKIMETARVLFAELKEIGVDFAKATEVNHQQFNREISAYELFRSFQVKLKKLVTEEEHSVSSFADLMERGRQANAEANAQENIFLAKMTAGLIRAGGTVAVEAARASFCNLTPVHSSLCRVTDRLVNKAVAKAESLLPKHQALAHELNSQFGIPLAAGKKYSENALLVSVTLLPVPPVARLAGRQLSLIKMAESPVVYRRFSAYKRSDICVSSTAIPPYNDVYFHTTTIENACKILSSGKIKRKDLGSFQGAFVSSRPELKYGEVVLALNRQIETAAPVLNACFQKRIHWAGFEKSIPVNSKCLEYVAAKHRSFTGRDLPELATHLSRAAGWDIQIKAAEPLVIRLKKRVKNDGLYVPEKWPRTLGHDVK